MYKLKKAFTLIELLVVIAIIGILASIVIESLSTAKAGARDARRVSDIKNIQLSLAEYYNDNLKYPVSLSSLSPTYMSVVPTDPDGSSYYNGGSYFYQAFDTSGGNCNNASFPAIKYHLATVLENATMPNDNIDGAGLSSYVACSPTSDFAESASPDCTTSNTPDRCYDVTNN